MTPILTLTLLEPTFTIHRLEPQADVPTTAWHSPFVAITRTEDELSLVLPDSIRVKSNRSEPGWACFKVNGPLDFGLVGILSKLTSALSEAGVSLFAVSTFETDYILVKREQVGAAHDALTSAGYQVT